MLGSSTQGGAQLERKHEGAEKARVRGYQAKTGGVISKDLSEPETKKKG